MKVSQSSKFIKTFSLSLLFCTITYLVLFFSQFGASVEAEWWVRDMYWVKDSIAEKIHTKKIIIIGGSNALFGISGELLEKKLNLPMVNLAGHGGLDIDFYRFKIDQFVGPGDLVIIPLEAEYYSRNKGYSEWFLNNIMAWGKNYFLSLGFLEKIRAIPIYRSMVGMLCRTMW